MEERILICLNFEENKKEDTEYYDDLILYLTEIYLKEVRSNE